MDNNITEKELVDGCLKKDPAFERMLFKKYAAKMLALCMRYIRNREEAEDILLEGFAIVFDKLQQFRSEGSFEGWIRKIMVNKAIEHYKQKVRLHPVIEIEEMYTDLPAPEDILSLIATRDLEKMIRELPPACNMVFNLYAFEQMSHREIAENLGIAIGTSKSNLSDARKLLQGKIRLNLISEEKIAI